MKKTNLSHLAKFQSRLLSQLRKRRHILSHKWSSVLCMIVFTLFVCTKCFSFGTTTISDPGHTVSGSYTQSGTTYNFSASQTFTGDLTIAANTVLIVTGTLNMGPGTTIHVVQTATLILNGATVTGTNTTFNSSIASNWWKGIEVLGTPTKHQPLISNVESGAYSTGVGASYYNQGAVWVHNNGGTPSTISYSLYGIWAGHINSPGSNGGGVIVCENSNFTNNWSEAIYFDRYASYPYTNSSRVQSCIFSYDGTYDNTHHVASNRAFIFAYNNVFSPNYPYTTTFAFNQFSVSNYTSSSSSPTYYGDNYIGIYTLECTYVSANTYPGYSNLYTGVMNWATGATGAVHTFHNESGFDNYISVNENGSTNMRSYFANFQTIGGFTATPSSTGIYMSGCTGFSIEESFLQSSSSTRSAASSELPGYGKAVMALWLLLIAVMTLLKLLGNWVQELSLTLL